MALGTGGHRNPSLMNRGIRIYFCLDPVETVTGRAGGGITSSPCCKNPVDTLCKLIGDIRMAGPTGLRNIGPKDRRLRIDERPQVMAPMAIRTRDLARHPMYTFLEFLFRKGRT